LTTVKNIKERFLFLVNDLFEWSVFSDLRAKQNAWHDYVNVFSKSREDLARLIQRPLTEAAVLVLGCGYNYPEVILFSGVSKSVVGIDVINAFYRDGLIRCVRDLRKRGSNLAFALFKGLLQRYRYHRYFDYLRRVSCLPISHSEYQLLSYGGGQIPLRDESFDIVLSNAVIQQVENLENLFREVCRITKEHGISYHFWHNYYSFSGSWAPESISLRYPWGHLRGKYKGRSGLNKITPTGMRNVFLRYFDLIGLYQIGRDNSKKGIDGNFHYERQELLSESIRNELKDFPLELLLTRSYLIIGRKKKHAPLCSEGHKRIGKITENAAH
jgi:SAM-dependent methyltransferase